MCFIMGRWHRASLRTSGRQVLCCILLYCYREWFLLLISYSSWHLCPCSRWHYHPWWFVGVPACTEWEPSEAERWRIHHTRPRRPLQWTCAGTHTQYSGWWAAWPSACAAMQKKGCQVSPGCPWNIPPPGLQADIASACQSEFTSIAPSVLQIKSGSINFKQEITLMCSYSINLYKCS